MVEIYDILVDKKMWRILEGIARGMTIEEIAEHANVSQKTAFNKIKMLEEKGIIGREK